MKGSFHRNLLIVLSAGLCLLCAYQWRIQNVQQVTLAELTRNVETTQLALRDATNLLRRADDQVMQLDEQLTGLRGVLRTNEQALAAQRRESQRLQSSVATQERLITEYKQAVAGLETKLKDAYAGIEKQNVTIKSLIAQRDELATKFNASIQDRNDVVARYNTLVKQVEQMQAALTNGPPPETKP